MTNVTPFRAKARAYRTPIDMLRALAAIDATLVYRRDLENVFISYEAPQRHHAEINAILSVLDRAGHTWRLAYIAAVLDLLAIQDSGAEPPIGETRRLDLRTAFVMDVPETGAEAFRLFAALNDAVGYYQSDRCDQWLCAVNRRNDILRIIESAAGTEFAADAACEARRFATEHGIGGGT